MEKEGVDDLRKALQLAVSKIIIEADREHDTRTSHSAMSALSELVFQYATKSLIPDLYAFSSHANRKYVITPDDVALVLRKLPSEQLDPFRRNYCSNTTVKKKDTLAPKKVKQKVKDDGELSLSSSLSSSSSSTCTFDYRMASRYTLKNRSFDVNETRTVSKPAPDSMTRLLQSVQNHHMLRKQKQKQNQSKSLISTEISEISTNDFDDVDDDEDSLDFKKYNSKVTEALEKLSDDSAMEEENDDLIN